MRASLKAFVTSRAIACPSRRLFAFRMGKMPRL
jgi:hypothetical protein